MTTILIGVLEKDLVYVIMALGTYITYKAPDFPDLLVDRTFPMGAALIASAVIAGVNPVLTLILTLAIGVLAGCVIGLIHVKFKVRDLLSGITVMTVLCSIDLQIAGGRANVPLLSQETAFENAFLEELVSEVPAPCTVLVILLVIVITRKILLDLYLKTRPGYLLRAVSDNDVLVTSLAKDKGTVKVVGLAIANDFAALAGAVYCQQEESFEVSVRTGTAVIGLANMIIGIQLSRRIGFMKFTAAVIIDSVIYKACVSFAISCGMEANDLKLVTVVPFLTILVPSNNRRRKVKAYV